MTIIAIVSIITPNTDNKIYGELEPLSKGIPLYFKNEEKANQDEGCIGNLTVEKRRKWITAKKRDM